MEFSTSTLMMIFFLIFLFISIWKIYAFLPNKQLKDDDTTPEATQELQKLMLKIIKQKDGTLDERELFLLMTQDEAFDSKLFWRFNLNRLKQLLNTYYIKHENISTIADIYKNLKD